MKPAVLGAALVAGLVGTGGYLSIADRDTVATGSIGSAAPAAPNDPRTGIDPRTAMNVVKVEWRREGLGLTAAADVSVRNNNAFAVRVDRISCKFRRKDGATADHAQGVYDIIQPRTERTIRNVSLGFVDSDAKGIDCSVAGARKDF